MHDEQSAALPARRATQRTGTAMRPSRATRTEVPRSSRCGAIAAWRTAPGSDGSVPVVAPEQSGTKAGLAGPGRSSASRAHCSATGS